MKELIQRFQLPTPEFWQKVIRIGLVLGSIGAGLIAAPEAGIQLPSFLVEIGKGLTTVGFLAAIMAKATVTDPTQIKK